MEKKSLSIRIRARISWLAVLVFLGVGSVPAFAQVTTNYITLTNSDAANTSSFATGLVVTNWSDGLAPFSGAPDSFNYYQTTANTLRGPTNGVPAADYTFAGDALELDTNGSLGLKCTNTVTVPYLVLNGGKLAQSGTGGNPDVAVMAGNINFIATSILSSSSGRTLDIAATITNDGTITGQLQANGGIVMLSGTNNYSGSTVVINTAPGTVLQMGSAGALPGGPLTLNGGSHGIPVVDLNGYNETVSTLSFSGGTYVGYITNSAFGTVATLTIGANGAPAQTLQNGTIVDNPSVGGTIGVTIAGLVLIHGGFTNNYSGPTIIDSGAGLYMGASQQLPFGPGQGAMIDNGELGLNGRSETVTSLSGTGTIDDNDTPGGPGNLIVSNSATCEFDGTIEDSTLPVTLTKKGAGALILTGDNAYSSNTLVSAGTLFVNGTIGTGAGLATVSNDGILGGSGDVDSTTTVTDGGTIQGGTTNGAGILTVAALDLGATNTDVTYSEFNLAAGGQVTTPGLNVSGTNYIKILGSGFSTGTYTLINYTGSIGGSNGFAGFQLSLPAGVTANLQNTGSAIQLVVTSVAAPQPHITGISLSGSNLVIIGTNGASGEQYNILTSTNLLLPLSQWTVLPTNTFSGSSFSLTNMFNPTGTRDYYIIRVP